MNYCPEEVLVADMGFVCGADLVQDFFKQHATNNDEEEARRAFRSRFQVCW